MCGIVGYAGWSRDPRASRADLEAMCDAIVHRGPDDAGYLVGPSIALGMRRLSVIDLEASEQPIGNEDGNVQVVFNGEIYNYRELRERLIRGGHRLATQGDTETLVHLYEEHGDRFVHELRGMFAFAIWDSRKRRLLLARDRVGIKPLYYREVNGGVAFASELKSLLQLSDTPREIDRGAIADYLALGYVPEPDCIFSGIRKLPPGHLLSWDADRGVQIERYWTAVRPEDASMDEEEAIGELRRLLSDAVRYHLVSDVPIGAFLSGGLDSSAVVAEMARQLDRRVQTFSIGFDEPEFNEAPYAAAVSRALGTDHHELVLRPDVEDLFERLILAFDEPFADSSAIPTFLVSRLARERVTVALSGDGGDELFGGYTRYSELLGRDVRLPAPVRAAIGGIARRLPSGARGRNRLIELSRTRSGRYAGMVADSLWVREGGVALAEVAATRPSHDSLLDRWLLESAGRDFPTRMMLADLASYLPGDILTKVDRMSMAVSLEARVPLLDHHLVEFASALPSRLKLRDGTGKWIFRRAMQGQVPAEALVRRKQGFGVPLRLWLRRELRHQLESLLRPDSPIYAYTDRAAVARVVREHLSNRRDHSPLLWKLLVLQLWLERCAAARPPEVAAPVVVTAGR